MKNLIFLTIVIILLFACSSNDEGIKLKKGSAEFEFAKVLAKNLPSMDPTVIKYYSLSGGFCEFPKIFAPVSVYYFNLKKTGSFIRNLNSS